VLRNTARANPCRTHFQFLQRNDRNGDKLDVPRYPSRKHDAAISDGHPRLKVSRKTDTMGSKRNNAETLKKSDKWRLTQESSAVEENVQAIKRWERAILLARSKAEQVSDWIACTAASGPVLLLHVLWFGGWVTVNSGFVGGIQPFDRFPFSFLTMTVSLEAIFLALFVLASQNRLSRQADKRSHLDLQVDLLAEREMTAVLQLLQDIASHLQVRTTVTPEQLRDLMKETDLRQLTNRMEELAEPVVSPPSMASESKEESHQTRPPDIAS
jgi:uncharacterized membrane protein